MRRKKDLKDLRKRVVYDSSVLIEMAYATKLGEIAKELMKEHDTYTTELAISETFYIICRKLGVKKAENKINNLLESGFIDVISISPIEAGKIKCVRSISLADCYIIALAKILNATSVFAIKEKELEREIKRMPFKVPVIFLEELIARQRKFKV
nr:PIN domain-containing protein [Candidatus Baldrarchaeota archaeon]